MNRQYFLLLLLISLVPAGCATYIAPATSSYTINTSCAATTSSSEMARSPRILKIAIPESTASISSRDILYQEGTFAQNPYAHSRWNETPDRMLHNLFLSCLGNSPVFTTVLPSYSKGKADYLLESTLLEFYHYINGDGSSEGRVRIMFYLIATTTGQVVASTEFTSAIGARSLDARGGVGALNEASSTIAAHLTQWLSSLDELIIR